MENIYLRRPYSLKQEELGYHLRDPQTGVILGAEPFFYPGSGKESVLMLHGYTSSPRDLRGLGQKLNGLGYTVSGILLPGHGTKPTDLDKVKWQEWYGAVVKEYERLKKSSSVVHTVGFSMGGALAMHLAANHPVGRIALLSPFFKIAYNVWHVLPEEWLVYTIGRLLRHLKKNHSGNCSDPIARQSHIAYYHYALSSINESLELVKVVKEELGRIQNPLLIVHAKGDKTTSPTASRRIYSQVQSRIKRFVWLHRSNHIITVDYDKDIVFKEVLTFFS
jgi:carboxylesterase